MPNDSGQNRKAATGFTPGYRFHHISTTKSRSCFVTLVTVIRPSVIVWRAAILLYGYTMPTKLKSLGILLHAA
jgi:hypothetical protein